jgi:cob(I)alamin adenosyltransferase
MRIYTRLGDGGETGLFGGPRVSKDDPRIEAIGSVDELNAALGVARTHPLPAALDELLRDVQHDLFAVGAELADSRPDRAAAVPRLDPARVAALEAAIDAVEATLARLTQFILPGGSPGAAALHLARAACRRAERRVVALARAQPADARSLSHLVTYLNRLGDTLFVLARAANQADGVPDAPWRPQTGR